MAAVESGDAKASAGQVRVWSELNNSRFSHARLRFEKICWWQLNEGEGRNTLGDVDRNTPGC